MRRRSSRASRHVVTVLLLFVPPACLVLDPLEDVNPAGGGAGGRSNAGADSGRAGEPVPAAGKNLGGNAGSPNAGGSSGDGGDAGSGGMATGGATETGGSTSTGARGEQTAGTGTGGEVTQAQGGTGGSQATGGSAGSGTGGARATGGNAAGGTGGSQGAGASSGSGTGGARATGGSSSGGTVANGGSAGRTGTGGGDVCQLTRNECQSIQGLIDPVEGCVARPAQSGPSTDCGNQPHYENCLTPSGKGYVRCFDDSNAWKSQLSLKARDGGGSALCLSAEHVQGASSSWSPVMQFVLGPNEASASFDPAGFSGIQFDYKSNVILQVYVSLNLDCQDCDDVKMFQYQGGLPSSNAWKPAELKFESFANDPKDQPPEVLGGKTTLQSVQFTLGTADTFEFCVDNLKFYR